tara:strand:- start:1275 stop:1496 length:222 start_codon:yes stop_codon:yes gene_type:complete
MESKKNSRSTCFRGGAFFECIGVEFNDLSKKNIINADALDAWFPPAPKIIEVTQSYLPWIKKKHLHQQTQKDS